MKLKNYYLDMMNYFFYKDYKFGLLIKHEAPLVVAAIMVSIIESINLLAIYSLLNTHLFYLHLRLSIFMTFLLVLCAIIMFVNLKYYDKNKEHICNKYKNESLLRNVFGYILYVTYFLGSIVLLYIMKEKLGYYV